MEECTDVDPLTRPSCNAMQLDKEFSQTLSLLAACPARTLKHVVWEAGRGIWGIPCPLCAPACLALQDSDFLTSAVDKVPQVLSAHGSDPDLSVLPWT